MMKLSRNTRPFLFTFEAFQRYLIKIEGMYNVLDHGDLLEKEAAAFIQSKFPYYERVWQIYIGNTGKAERAPLPDYPDEGKRVSFAEHSYSTLEACFLIQNILDSKVFESEINSFASYLEFNKSFITIFGLLGRIHDNVIKASSDLKYDNRDFCHKIHEFYEARNIVIHGRKIPIVFDEYGLVKMPILKTASIKGEAWNDKVSNWSDISSLPKEYVADNCGQYFEELLQLINSEYARFFDIVCQELKAIPTALTFVRLLDNLQIIGSGPSIEPSGSTRTYINVYSFKENFPR